MALEIYEVANRIEAIVAEIGKFRKQIEDKGKERAKAIKIYDMKIGTAVVTLKEEGKWPATLIEKIAKKLCAEERYELELAESGYKACISNLTALMAQLNGYQSIFRHLDST